MEKGNLSTMEGRKTGMYDRFCGYGAGVTGWLERGELLLLLTTAGCRGNSRVLLLLGFLSETRLGSLSL